MMLKVLVFFLKQGNYLESVPKRDVLVTVESVKCNITSMAEVNYTERQWNA